MSILDYVAITVFAICWFGYEHVLKLFGRKAGYLARHISVIREGWMENFIRRDVKLFDSQLLGHSVNSASFFASSNLILIAAISGAIIDGGLSKNLASSLGIVSVSQNLLELKFIIVVLCLIRGLLNFIWSLRQMNYCAAGLGAIPSGLSDKEVKYFANALTKILEPAMSNFSQGVRGYYFAVAAAMWLYGPIYLLIGTFGSIALLLWRQSRSSASKGIRLLREGLDNYYEAKESEKDQ